MGRTAVLVVLWYQKYIELHNTGLLVSPCAGFRGCMNRPTPFPGQLSYKATKPGLICLVISL